MEQQMSSRKPCQQFAFGKSSLVSRHEPLFLSEYMSDVVFRVGGNRGQLFHAHKLILTAASEVFYAQFNGGFAEAKQDNRKNPIVIEDITPETFREVLRYIYCEKIDLTADNIIEVCRASHKYLLTGLNSVCETFLKGVLNESNVMKIFNANRLYGAESVNKSCLEIIKDNPIKCFQSKDFLALDQKALELIAACRTMNCRRAQICEAIQRWCKANGSKADITPHWEVLQCRKLFAFGSHSHYYTQNVHTDIQAAVKGNLYLYGLGVFVGLDSYAGCRKAHVELIVKIEPSINVSRKVVATQDLYIEEILFEKVTVKKNCRINVKISDTSGSNMFCMNTFVPVCTSSAKQLTISDIYGSSNCVAYILYNLDNAE